ncbi:MAG: hypothetical protein QFX40_06840 [Archaeoglobales archaeon]|nr:hypothetical protein [Archaeoglobales archaeon]
MLHYLLLSSFAMFFIAILLNFSKYFRAVHLRCEVYPIPHEINYKHGGSYYEWSEWWRRSFERPRRWKLKTILGILLINRKKMSLQPKHWFATFMFHLGIFFHAIWILMWILCAFFNISTKILKMASLLAFFGSILMLAFGMYLFLRKLRPPLRYYVPLRDHLILIFVLLLASTGLLNFLEDFHIFPNDLQPFFESFKTVHLILYSALILSLPLTKVTHYIALIFTHLILWDNEKMSEKLEERLKEKLHCRVEWGAQHIAKKTWIENFLEVEK